MADTLANTDQSRRDPANSLQSSLRASILEHIFIGEVGRALWCAGVKDFEILRGEVDAKGHDLVIECCGIVRHIQLKSTYHGSKVDEVTVSLDLQRKRSGCVVWLEFDAISMTLGPYHWLGGAPGEGLPRLGDKVAQHTRARRTVDGVRVRSPRLNHRVVKKTKFTRFADIAGLVRAMFGELDGSRTPASQQQVG
jgi:hypothetical protein